MAIANNPDLAAGRYDPRDQRRARRAGAVPRSCRRFTSGVAAQRPAVAAEQHLLRQQGVRTDVWSATSGLGQRLPWGGGIYNVGWTSTRTNASSSLSNFNPSVTAPLQAVFSQPLLRDFKIDPFRAQVTTAQRNQRDRRHRPPGARRARSSASAERAYWNLVLATGGGRRAAALARSVARARAEQPRARRRRPVAAARPRVGAGRSRAAAREPDHRADAGAPGGGQAPAADHRSQAARLLVVRLEPADLVPPVGPAPDVDAAVRNALDAAHRPRADAQADSERRHRRGAREERDAAGSAAAGHLPDQRPRRDGAARATASPAPSSDSSSRRSATCSASCSRRTTRRGRSASRSAIRSARAPSRPTLRATAARARAGGARLRSAELKAVREVRQAALQLEQNRQRIETTQAGARAVGAAARRRAEALRGRDVDELQRDPGAARSRRRAQQRAAGAARLPAGAGSRSRRSRRLAVRSAGRSRIWRPPGPSRP